VELESGEPFSVKLCGPAHDVADRLIFPDKIALRFACLVAVKARFIYSDLYLIFIKLNTV
jgi:hypothetical protein